MIAYLFGKVQATSGNYLILNVGGVGYKIFYTFKKSYTDGDACELFIHNQIREDASDLYGFDSLPELEIFEKLISVNGVGPKAGVAIMSIAEPDRITSAIIQEDVAFFQAVSGIGKKVAAKIILDLKGKIAGLAGFEFQNLTKENDVAEALTALGYKNLEISAIITKIPTEISSSEEKVRWCLKNLTK